MVKIGRTQLQDAVPMTLGQEFIAFANTLADELSLWNESQRVFYEISMGGTRSARVSTLRAGYARSALTHLGEDHRLPDPSRRMT